MGSAISMGLDVVDDREQQDDDGSEFEEPKKDAVA